MDTLLQRLLAIDGVTGALLARRDGSVLAATVPGEEAEVLAAMAVAAFDSASRYLGQLGAGETRHALFETASGAIQVADGGDKLIVVRSAYYASLGRIRLEMQRARPTQ